MNNFEIHFSDYIKKYVVGMHNNTNTNSNDNIITSNIYSFNNLIIYGPSGIGKYSHSLYIISNYSQYKLNYEKKMAVTFNKNVYYYKISDIHYEIDMSQLGCNSRLLWHEIFNYIFDSIMSKNEKYGIILCKNFHEIHNELLDIFYSYMQNNNNYCVTIKYILLTEDYSFIPDNILKICNTIKLLKPTKNVLNKILKTKLTKSYENHLLENIKDIQDNSFKIDFKLNNLYLKEYQNKYDKYKVISKKILKQVINIDNINYIYLREILYDICIYNLIPNRVLFSLIEILIIDYKIDNKQLNNIMIKVYEFLKFYNNNYRPIYHLEKIILYISTVVNGIS